MGRVRRQNREVLAQRRRALPLCSLCHHAGFIGLDPTELPLPPTWDLQKGLMLRAPRQLPVGSESASVCPERLSHVWELVLQTEGAAGAGEGAAVESVCWQLCPRATVPLTGSPASHSEVQEATRAGTSEDAFSACVPKPLSL